MKFLFKLEKKILLYFILLFQSCSPVNIDEKTFIIRGRVMLEDSSKLLGTKVCLFSVPILDSGIVNAINKYPFLVHDLDLFIFDHRRSSYLAQTETNEDGFFSFEDIPSGEYILFVQRDGYGWNYYKVSTASNKILEIYLKKEVTVSGTLTGVNILSERNYVIVGNIEIPEGSTLYISEGSVIRFTGPYEIKVNGKIQVKSEVQRPIVFTSNDTSIVWKGIYLFNADAEINFVVIRDANIGVYVENGNLNALNLTVFSNKAVGLSLVNINRNKKVFVKNCFFAYQPIGINIEFSDTSVFIVNSIFALNSESAINALSSSARIIGNYFLKNRHSVQIWSSANIDTLKLINNDFTSSTSYQILHRGGIVQTRYNNIYSSNGGIYILPAYGNPINLINWNNLTGAKFIIYLGSFSPNINAKYNYWGTVSETKIRDLIFDRNDVSHTDPYYNTYGYVDYSNYLHAHVKEAKIIPY